MKKLVVVTGGTKGIGRAVIEKFMAHDFDAATCARKPGELESLKQQLESTHKDKHVFTTVADLSDRAQVKSFTDFVLGLNRPVDVLVNNAGYFVPGSITTEPEGTLESMVNANLYSAYHTTRGIVPAMKKNKAGHIFNICSIASIKAYANGGSYAITKFALLGFSKCLREEVKADNIRVTAVLPGATKTASWDGVNLPDERFMKVEDVAEMIYAAWSLSTRSVVEEILIRPQLGDI
ncbi:MAG: SDR family NAD(P)-dependent oxidoreductase [Flammeovirgaceae bacterium]|nr:MAG: SDR family NAD(P)-dependent oxidoreductase [Flammeovirgaceae bacterium]